MNLIKPCPHKPAKTVKKWSEIKDDAMELRKLIIKGNFAGHYKDGFAISHASVSEKPMNFFVINEITHKGEILKMFGHWCIINLKIIKYGHPVSFEEACMSFPFLKPKKINRMAKIKVVFQVPSWLGTMRKKTKTLTSVAAFICQHELEHAAGKNIYGK